MNFQAVDQANGENVMMWATLDTWDSIAFTPNQAKYLACKLIDDDGVGYKCRIYEGKGSLPGKENEKQRLEFNLSCYKGTTSKGRSYTGYSGFWSHGATTSAPQGGFQASQNHPQSPKAPQMGKYDVGIRRSIVCAYLASGSRPLAEDVEYWIEYIKTGVDASLPDNRPTENQPEDRRKATNEDVPW